MFRIEWMQNAWLSIMSGILILAIFLVLHLKKNRNLPPGPWGIPLLGYLPFLGKFSEKTFMKLKEKYGNIMSLYLGNKLIIVLGDYNIIQEALMSRADFAGRPEENVTKIYSNDTGVASVEGEFWKIHRRFILKTFRDYGMGKLSLEPKIQEEIRHFLETLAACKTQPKDPQRDLTASVANVIGIIECGTRFEYSDKSFIRLCTLLSELPEQLAFVGLRIFMPWIPFISSLTGEKRLRKIKDEPTEIFNRIIREHMKSLTEGNCTNYIDAYLTERNRTIQNTGSEGYFRLKTLNDNLFELFAAAMDTTTTTLRWALLFVMSHPEVQDKLQQEIDEVVGMERLPSMNDRPNMIYTEATLMETHRMASILPLNLIHSNDTETTLGGYRIPKRSFIFAVLKAVHSDPTIWKDPEIFRPERFIHKGKLIKSQYMIPFSLGKRACIGESLAKMELFLYLTSIFQRFTLQFPEGFEYSLEPHPGAVQSPKPFLMRAHERPGYMIS